MIPPTLMTWISPSSTYHTTYDNNTTHDNAASHLTWSTCLCLGPPFHSCCSFGSIAYMLTTPHHAISRLASFRLILITISRLCFDCSPAYNTDSCISVCSLRLRTSPSTLTPFPTASLYFLYFRTDLRPVGTLVSFLVITMYDIESRYNPNEDIISES